MNLFAAAEARDRAIDIVEANMPNDWREEASRIIFRLARTCDEFTTDEVWAGLSQPPEPRALGAVMRQAQRDGWIRPTDRVRNSVRVECHARPVRVWVGVL